jgi:hypothetical protein
MGSDSSSIVFSIGEAYVHGIMYGGFVKDEDKYLHIRVFELE